MLIPKFLVEFCYMTPVAGHTKTWTILETSPTLRRGSGGIDSISRQIASFKSLRYYGSLQTLIASIRPTSKNRRDLRQERVKTN